MLLKTTTLIAAALAVCHFASASEVPSDLYYEVPAPFSESTAWELRAGSGFDFSNPYLGIHSFRATGYRILSPLFAVGIEGTLYSSRERDAAKTLETNLRPYGYETRALAPQWSGVGVLRVTPLSGLVKVFQRQVWSVEIGLLLRGGAIRYQDQTVGPLIGTGLEVALGIAKDFGLAAGLVWDGDSVPGRAWQSRVGFHLAPVVRF